MKTLGKFAALLTIATTLVFISACGGNPAGAGVNAANAGKPFEEKKIEGNELKFSNDGSTLNFTAAKVSLTHKGGFKKFSGTVTTDKDGKEVVGISAEIEMDSVWTDDPAKTNEKLTNHLKTADFFDVPKFPKANFVATSITKDGDKYKVDGNFTLHGEKKGITFPANISVKDGEVTAKAKFKINRREFNINYPGAPNDLISDEVVIELDIKAKK
ncbi:MAG: YceI family protein [Planctomycetes bacterium]|nr:YceI family protein [Planctomycetota bacterium]